MLKNFLSIGLFVMIVALCGCGNADYVRNNDGLIYRIIKTGKGNLVKPRTYLKIHQSAAMGDTTFFNSFGKIPSFGFFDSLQKPSHDFLDVLTQMRVGDSAIIIRSVDTLVKRGVVTYNERFKKGSTLKVTVKVLGVFDTEEEMEKERKIEMDQFKKQEIAAVESYLNSKNTANFEKLAEGVFLVIEKQGTGTPIEDGMEVTVKYTGALTNGTVFDSNVDSTFGRTDPFKFIVGVGQVIQGWDIGIRKLKVGSKAKFYIPSTLGYGFQGSGAKIPPYSNLVFDIEVLEAVVKIENLIED